MQRVYAILYMCNLIGQILSGVIFMMMRGCIRTKVQLRPIHETKCVPETDALTVYKDEINLHSSFLTPLLVEKFITFPLFYIPNNLWCLSILYWT
jgi:hypothetical protein